MNIFMRQVFSHRPAVSTKITSRRRNRGVPVRRKPRRLQPGHDDTNR
jgi:hypothetical protein